MKNIKQLTQTERTDILNIYYENYPNERIYSIDELLELYPNLTHREWIQIKNDGNYNAGADYFYIDAYNHFVSLTDEQKEERENMYLDDFINDLL